MKLSNLLTIIASLPVRSFKPKVSLAELINAEAIEGGKLFDKEGGHLFVLDDRNQMIEQQYGGEVLDFVYAKLDPKTRQTQYAIVYRVTDNSIDKIYNGRIQPLSLDELENLLKVIEAYRVMIRDKFYPIDAFLEDPDGNSVGDTFNDRNTMPLFGHVKRELSGQALTKL